MSFDLSLFRRPGEPPLGRQEFFAYFQGERYEHDGEVVRYGSADTGVYFTLGFREAEVADPKAAAARPGRSYVSFNMNYCRPHTFALEAERILTPFVRRFRLLVDDPQAEGMGRGEYSPEGFLRSWNAGNRFACQAMRPMQTLNSGLTLPAAVNRSLWRWNFERHQLCEALLEEDEIGVFVPSIMFYRADGQVRTFCVFPNLVPTAVPRVDRVYAMRNELSPPHDQHNRDTPGWPAWDELRAVAARFDVVEDRGALPFLLLFGDDYLDKNTAPKKLARWVAGLPDWPGRPDLVRPDQILDAELVQPETAPAGS